MELTGLPSRLQSALFRNETFVAADDPIPNTAGDAQASRLEKLRRIEALGIDPWGGRFDNHQGIEQILGLNADLIEGERPKVKAAGRIVSRRLKGKLHFIDLWDASGSPQMRTTREQEGREATEFLGYSSQIQLMLGAKQVGEAGWALAQELDLGDLIGVEGSFGKTKMGEKTIFVEKVTILAKSLEPHPDKWGGMADIEYRLRHRYLDLTYTPETMERAKQRVKIVRTFAITSTSKATSKSRRRRCTPSRVVPRPGRSSRITTRSTSTSCCASRWSCTLSACSWVASKRFTRLAASSATRGSRTSTIPNSR